jgi:hypothetical protein
VQLQPDDVRALQQLGLSPGFVAAYNLGQAAVCIVVYCALGALLVWRRSQDRMALFSAYTLVLQANSLFPVMEYGLALAAPAWYALYGVLIILGQTVFLAFLSLFPSGRFVPRWTRWCVLLYGLLFVYNVFFYDVYHNTGPGWSNVLTFALLLVGVGTQVYRYRRVSTPRERQQTKWVVFGFSLTIVIFTLMIFLGNAFLPQEVLQSQVVTTFVLGNVAFVCFLLIPISIVFAILRSRLYDIDALINKALVYGSLTALLGALYAGLIIGLTSLAGTIVGTTDQPVVLVVSTLVIASLFYPLRRRIQSLIDRRFYRRKYDAEKTLAAFNATLRNEVDLAEVREHLLRVVQETMQPAQVSLWLRQPERREHPRVS